MREGPRDGRAGHGVRSRRAEPGACHDRRSAMKPPVRIRPSFEALLAFGLAAGLLGACAPSATPAPSVRPGPSASVAPAPTTISTPEAAATVVLASDTRFAGIERADPNRIGQCCSYSATPAAGGFAVTVEIGWGDCPAGCINRHHWFY